MTKFLQFLTKYLLLSIFVFSTNVTFAQLISGNVFMQGNHIEVGIAPNGSFGTGIAAPAGYHARTAFGGGGGPANLGFVADPALDGWTIGTPNYIGCFFLPGVPQEGWDMAIGGTWYRAYRNDGPNSFWPAGSGWTGSNGAPYVVGSRRYSVWTGAINDLSIQTTTHFDTTQLYFMIDVKLKNTGTATINDIFYSRTLDPDNESAVPGGVAATTTNVIEYQPDVTTGDYRALVSARGLGFPDLSYLGIGAYDCRAKVYIRMGNGNLFPHAGPDQVWDGTGLYFYDVGQGNEADVAMGIIFNIGNLAPGDSTTFTYTYVLSADDLDTAFNNLTSGWNIDGTTHNAVDNFFDYVICRGADSLKIEMTGGGGFVWGDWEPNIGLANPSGRNNTIAMPNAPITYRIIGTNPVCPLSDTVYLRITPVGDTVLINADICAGNVYDFNGQTLYSSGVYYQTHTTAIDGCDSVVKLTLNVNPLPGISITVDNTSLCEGDVANFQVLNPTANTNYQWLRNGTPIAGATDRFYIAPSLAGEYRVVGVTDKGCVDTSRRITLTINSAATVNLQALNIANICIGDTIKFSVSETLPGYEYYWEPEKSFRYSSGARHSEVDGIMFEASNVIRVRGVNQYGCMAYDEMVVNAVPCCDVYLPTAFSPNGDGLNDYFTMLLREGQKLVSFQIFDRGGKMVYDNGSKMGWNGKDLDGNEVAQAVYYYRIVYSCTDKKNYEAKGDITVIK